MYSFIWKVGVYFICFVASMYGLSSLDFNRFLKRGRVAQANILYLIIALSLAYLSANLLMDIIYVMN